MSSLFKRVIDMVRYRQQNCKPVFRIRILMFLGLLDPDPDPLVRSMDLDPDPSIIMQK
jgi:hypothetical protein